MNIGKHQSMATLVRHGVFKTTLVTNKNSVFSCYYATKAEKKKGIDRKVTPKIDPNVQYLASKGFLRPQKEYNPPSDVDTQISALCKKVLGTTDTSTKLQDISKKFNFLNECFKAFQHSIPNSLLHKVESVNDVKVFYATPVDVRTPLDKLKNMDLPENLHIQYDYHRFHPETDTKFNGITAFPESSTMVTGLKYKEKYRGYTVPKPFPHKI